MDDIQQFIASNGIEPVLTELGRIRDGDAEPHEFADEHDIDEEEWFEFLWRINDELSPKHSISEALPIPDFNYRAVDRAAEQFDWRAQTPYTWGELVDAVAEETGVDKETVNSWLGGYPVERNENDDIVSLQVR